MFVRSGDRTAHIPWTYQPGMMWTCTIHTAMFRVHASGHVMEIAPGIYAYRPTHEEIARPTVWTLQALASDGTTISTTVEVVPDKTPQPAIYFTIDPPVEPRPDRADRDALDVHARDYGLQRTPGESDEGLRGRILTLLRGGR